MFRMRLYAAAVLCLTAASARAADRNADFLAALREQGWDDTAVEFLDWVETSPLATKAFLNELSFERAVSTAARGRRARNREERKSLLARAAADFKAFSAANADSPRALDALRQSANLFAEIALAKAGDLEKLPPTAAASREQLGREARKDFADSIEAAEQLIEAADKRLRTSPVGGGDAPSGSALSRDELGNRKAEAQFLKALVSFESARTHGAASPERRNALNRAAAMFGDLHEQYRGRLVGASSRFYQGRCAQETGDFQKALGCYEDLVRQPSASEEFRRWTARAQRRRTECLLAQGNVDAAIQGAEQWLEASRPSERQEAEWLEVSYRLADAYQSKVKAGDQRASKAKDLEDSARQILRDVSQHPNEFQAEARMALASLGRTGNDAATPKKFADAYAAGRSALELMSSSEMAVNLARQNNPDAVAELQQRALDHKLEAMRLLEAALALADRQTSIEELTATRYYLAWLYWDAGRTEEAAVLATFLVKNYPHSSHAGSAARVALAAWDKLIDAARAAGEANPAYEWKALLELAESIAAQRPGSSEAASAVNILITAALEADRVAQAEELLAKLPADSRAFAELRLGAALWNRSLKQPADAQNKFSPQVNSDRERAAALLASGFASLQKAKQSSPAAVAASLYLAHHKLDSGDAAGAIAVLEDKAVGPLTLVTSKNQAATNPELVRETYKTALRSYLAVVPPDRAKVEQTLNALEDAVDSEGGDGGDQLARIYAGLGVQLQERIRQLTAAGDNDKANAAAEALDLIMKRVSTGADGSGGAISQWVADTNLEIGRGLAGTEAKPYLMRAKAAYEAVLKAAKAKPPSDEKQPPSMLAVHKRLGDCHAALGEYDAALKQYAEVLRQRPTMLDVQQAAAETLQRAGEAKKDQTSINRAIHGALPQADKKNLVWGWVRLANVADSARRQTAAKDPAASARYANLFFEARYKVAEARFSAAMLAKDTQRQQLEATRQNIESMRRLYPDLAQSDWKDDFDQLDKRAAAQLQKLQAGSK